MDPQVQNNYEESDIEYSPIRAAIRVGFIIIAIAILWIGISFVFGSDSSEDEDLDSETSLDISASVSLVNVGDESYFEFNEFNCLDCEGFIVYLSKDLELENKIDIGVIYEDQAKRFYVPPGIDVDSYEQILIWDSNSEKIVAHLPLS